MKSKLQLTALTMGLVLVAASAANAQNLTLPEFLSLGGTGEINQVPQITYPSVDGFTWVDLADYVAPVANFTGFRLNGTAIAPADLIPLRSTSIVIVDDNNIPVVTIDKNGIAPKKEFLSAYSNVTQSFTVAGFANFGTTAWAYSSPSASIIYTTNTVTLKAGKSYRLEFTPSIFYTNTPGCWIDYRWENASTSAAVGSTALVVAADATRGWGTPIADALVTPTVTTTYRVRVTPYVAGTHNIGTPGWQPTVTVIEL